MSSRELLVFIEYVGDESKTKTAMRRGDWTAEQYFTVRIINELMSLRADNAALAGQSMRPTLILSPAQMAEKDDEEQLRIDLHDMMIAQMSGQFVPPKREVVFEVAEGAHEELREWKEVREVI